MDWTSERKGRTGGPAAVHAVQMYYHSLCIMSMHIDKTVLVGP